MGVIPGDLANEKDLDSVLVAFPGLAVFTRMKGTSGLQLKIKNIMSLPRDIYQRIASAKMYIDENYHEAIDLGGISQRAFLSRFHFHRLFTKIYHRTPHQYLTRKRLDRAKDLLSQNRPVSEVCGEVGFESIGSFSVLFKKEIGFAPTYYRNMAWLKKQKQKQEPRSAIPSCFLEGYNLIGRPQPG